MKMRMIEELVKYAHSEPCCNKNDDEDANVVIIIVQ